MKSSNPFEVLRQVTSKSSLNTTSSSDSCRNVISSSASSASCENSTSTSSGNSTSTSIQSGNSTSTNSQSGNSTLASSSTTVNNAIVPVIKNHTKPLPSENIYRLDENSLLIALTETFKISFHGRVIIKVLHGKLQIFGYVLDEESKAYPCYNPLVQSLHCMEISPCTRSKKTWNFEQKVNDFMNRFADIATIIQLSDLTFDGLDELEFEYPEFNLFNPVLPLPYDERMSLRGFYPFHNTPKLFPELQLDTEWIEFADKVVKSSSVSAICGPKNVGKSSFSRYLVNRLLNQHQQVAYLECDIGQPEFSNLYLHL